MARGGQRSVRPRFRRHLRPQERRHSAPLRPIEAIPDGPAARCGSQVPHAPSAYGLAAAGAYAQSLTLDEDGALTRMCGIAGIYAYHYAAKRIEPTELRVIRDYMAARGPDGEGEWCSPDGRIGLGHRRLAIIDLSEGGAQPMSSADGKITIVLNGEIYNYVALRAALERQG